MGRPAHGLARLGLTARNALRPRLGLTARNALRPRPVRPLDPASAEVC